MNDKKIKKLVLTALFTALCCVATMIIKIPTPGTGGYVHLGDAFVLLSGLMLGPWYGALAGGLGSALADLLGGYMLYVPVTFVIKALVALAAGFVANKIYHISPITRCVIAGAIGTVIVAFGYFSFEFIIYGAGAVASIIPNMIQGFSGLIISAIVHPILVKIIRN